MRVLILICFLFMGAAAQTPAPLPEFSLPKLEGQVMRSQDLRESIVVLDFWATWCESCSSEIPAFNKLEKDYSSHGVKVIGLSVQSGWASDIRKYVKEFDMRYTILVGNDDTVTDFDVISFPKTYVIGPGWKVYKKYSGVSKTKAEDIRQDIETLIKAQAVERKGETLR